MVPTQSSKPGTEAMGADDFPGADHWVPADVTMPRLREAAQACQGCNLCFSGTKGKRRIHASPDLAHMTACAPWLSAELAVVQPRGVVVLGATAGRAIFGRSFKVTARRGQILTLPETPEGCRSQNGWWPRRTLPPFSDHRIGTRPSPRWSQTSNLPPARLGKTYSGAWPECARLCGNVVVFDMWGGWTRSWPPRWHPNPGNA